MSCRDTEEGSPTERASSFQHTHYDNVLISLLARLQVRTICYFVRFREQLDIRPIVVSGVGRILDWSCLLYTSDAADE